MPAPKPPYPAPFRQQMIELVRAGRGISDLARKFGCNEPHRVSRRPVGLSQTGLV